MKPVDRTVEVNGLRLHYRDWGGSAVVPALAFHGFALNCCSWDEIAPSLGGHVRLLAFDQRGHGLSEWAPKLEDYTRQNMVADIEGIFRRLGLESAVLIGHSMGGLNAMTFAATRPELVRALVLIDVGPEVPVDGALEVVRFVAGPYELESLEAWVEHTHRYYPYRSKERIRKRLENSLRKTESGKLAKQFDPRFREAEFSGIAENFGGLWDIARALRCPTLLVHGGASPVYQRESAENFAATIGCVRMVSIPGAGHSVAGDKPEEFVAEVGAFLSEILSN